MKHGRCMPTITIKKVLPVKKLIGRMIISIIICISCHVHAMEPNKEEDLDALLARVKKNLANIKQSLDNSRKILLPSPRTQKFQDIIKSAEETSRTRPEESYELFLDAMQRHKDLFINITFGEYNASLHAGIEKMAEHNDPMNYVLFAAMLECGVDTALVCNGKILLDTALETGNDLLVQLLTTDRPTKQTLIDLAYEHHRDDLLPYLLSEEECLRRSCQEDTPNNNNNSNF